MLAGIDDTSEPSDGGPGGSPGRSRSFSAAVLPLWVLAPAVLDGVVNFFVNLPGYIQRALFIVGTTTLVILITVASILAVVVVPYAVVRGFDRALERALGRPTDAE